MARNFFYHSLALVLVSLATGARVKQRTHDRDGGHESSQLEIAEQSQQEYGSAAELAMQVQFWHNLGMDHGSISNTTADWNECNSIWTRDLTRHGFSNHRFAGAGAAGCVYEATYEDSQVAVKVAKTRGAGRLHAWQEECRDMQELRLKQCMTSESLFKLGEAFDPTCLMAGATASGSAFMIQNLAPLCRLGKLGRKCPALEVDDQKKVFAQFVAAVWSLHGIGASHNDLHAGNIVINTDTSPPQLALVDFGSVRHPMAKAKLSGSKRDANALWRHSATLAGCNADAQWIRSRNKQALSERKPKFLECMKDKWNAGPDFIEAFAKVMDGNIESSTEQHVEGLFKSKFVQDNLPPLEPTYRWPGTYENGGCLDWDEQTWKDKLPHPEEIGMYSNRRRGQ
jgi:hypothetical protein